MRTVDQYIDDAKRKSGITSDREISRHLGWAGNRVNHWRCKRAWPSDEAMVKLAIMGGHDPEEALLDLGRWRTEGAAREVYERLLKLVEDSKAGINAAAVVLLFSATLVLASPSQASSAALAMEHHTNGSPPVSSLYTLCD